MIHAQPDPVVGVDASGRIRAWNASATTAFGYSEEEAYGCELDALLGVVVNGKPCDAKTKSATSLSVVAESVALGARDAPAIVSMIVLRVGAGGSRSDAHAEIRDLPPRLRQIL